MATLLISELTPSLGESCGNLLSIPGMGLAGRAAFRELNFSVK